MITTEDVAEAMLGPLVEGRACGACITCCSALTIETEELRKPAGILCTHNNGKGCMIYGARPGACRNWHCGWRRLEMLPDRFRPDRSGVMISFQIELDATSPLERCCIILRVTEPALVAQQDLAALLHMLRRARIPIWLGEGTRRTLAHPDAEVGRHLIAGTNPGGALGQEVASWQQRLFPAQ